MRKRLFFIILSFAMIFGLAGNVYAANAYTINGKTVRYNDVSSSPNDCWNYAQSMYKKIWGSGFSALFDENINMLRNYGDSSLTLTVDHLRTYVGKAALGSTIRICSSEYLHGYDNWGHSQIIVKKDNNGFTVFQGGLSAAPYCNERYYTWSEYVSIWTAARFGYKYIKYIKWPGGGTTPTNNNISISGQNAPGTLNVGNVFSISGTVSSGSKLTNVTAGVYDQNGNMKTGRSTNPGSNSYNIKGLDNYVYFNHLAAGIYQYKVIASNSSKTVTLVSKVFVVLGKTRTINDGTYNFCSKGNNSLGLSINGNTYNDSGNVLLWTNTKENNFEKWRITYIGDGYYKIINVQTGKALDVSGAGNSNGTNVQQYTPNGTPAQMWQFISMGSSYYCLVPKCATGRCLDISGANYKCGTNLQIYEANLTGAQQFKFTSTSKYTPSTSASTNLKKQSLSISKVTKTVTYTSVKKKAVVVAPITKVTGNIGSLSYSKTSGSANLTVNKTTGKVTVKKGTKRGTYTANIKVTAAKTSTYKSASKTVKITVKVK